MGKVALEGMEFFAYHGYYDEEQKMGNKYSVDVAVETDLTAAAQHDALAETINYEVLYKIIAQVMSRPSRLLETLNMQIIQEVFKRFPVADRVEVNLSKFNPPIGGVCREAKVTMSKTRDEIVKLKV
ncbi:dihydroneopterin aldolase [Cesiribacter sp. SM1]|uniref:dihydroneopterin aldolase n=1 Tax=Cesiribacter sp. SM1 TaxID=2861196 RepID=UPI001CD5D184|nr:dihydroneopterin aldolase [Cesiribacter sp. SM1]